MKNRVLLLLFLFGCLSACECSQRKLVNKLMEGKRTKTFEVTKDNSNLALWVGANIYISASNDSNFPLDFELKGKDVKEEFIPNPSSDSETPFSILYYNQTFTVIYPYVTQGAGHIARFEICYTQECKEKDLQLTYKIVHDDKLEVENTHNEDHHHNTLGDDDLRLKGHDSEEGGGREIN